MRPGKILGDLQRARSIRLPILESPKLSSEVSESKGRDILLSHLQIHENSMRLVKNHAYKVLNMGMSCYLADELPSALSIAELDLNASAMLMPLSIDGLFTRLLSRLPARPFCDKLKS